MNDATPNIVFILLDNVGCFGSSQESAVRALR